jgi:hypothetical protein
MGFLKRGPVFLRGWSFKYAFREKVLWRMICFGENHSLRSGLPGRPAFYRKKINPSENRGVFKWITNPLF